MNILSINKVPL